MEESYQNGKDIEMNLIERLREVEYELHPTAHHAADELERLQAQIAAMTKDIESMRPWRELQRENEELRNRHKELREANLYLNERLREAIKELHPLKGRQELAALKAQSTEPVAEFGGMRLTPEDTNEFWGWMIADPHDITSGTKLFTTPPTATALVEDFKRRAIAVLNYIPIRYGNDGICLTEAKSKIESLPLINDFNQGEK